MSDTAAAPAAPAAPSSASTSAPAPTQSAGSAPAPASPPAAPPEAKALPFQDTPAAAPETAAEKKAEAQRIKLKTKVDGKEAENEYTIEELTLLAQKGLGSDKRFNEAANIQKVFKEFKAALKDQGFAAFSDPAFSDLGDVKQLFIDHLYKEFQAEELQKADPREYELQQLRAKNEAYERRQKEAEEKQRAAAQAEADKKQWEVIRKDWVSALERSGLAENEVLVQSMAQIGKEFLERGMDLSPDVLVAELKNRLSAQNRMLFGGLKGQALVNGLGEEIVNEILQFKVAQVQKTREVEPIKPPDDAPKPNSGEEDGQSERPSKYLRNLREFLQGE